MGATTGRLRDLTPGRPCDDLFAIEAAARNPAATLARQWLPPAQASNFLDNLSSNLAAPSPHMVVINLYATAPIVPVAARRGDSGMTTDSLNHSEIVERVRAFSHALPHMSDRELFEAFSAVQEKLAPMAPDAERFEEMFWNAVNAEVEIIGRFPGKRLAAFDEWRDAQR